MPGGLSSYPHPWLNAKILAISNSVNGTWSYAMAIYQARFLKYLINRGFVKR